MSTMTRNHIAHGTSGGVFRMMRLTLGLTLPEAAGHVGLSAAQLGRVERSEVQRDPEVDHRLTVFYGTTKVRGSGYEERTATRRVAAKVADIINARPPLTMSELDALAGILGVCPSDLVRQEAGR